MICEVHIIFKVYFPQIKFKMEENLKTREKTNSHVILTMIMIVLVIIINIIVGKCISKRINPEEKINELNQ